MRRVIGCAVLLAIAATALGFAPRQDDAPSTPTETFAVDAVHSTALFRVHHLGASRFWGRFNELAGTITSGDGGAGLALDVTIKTDSVDTSNEKLDNHLRSPDFFNAKEFPTMTFKSTSVAPAGNGFFDVTGDMTIRGTTRSITARVEWTGTAEMGMGRRCGYEAKFKIKRSDFSVMYGVDNGMLSDEIDVIVSLEGVKR